MSESTTLTFSDRHHLDAALAESIAATLRQAIETRGEAVLVVSGGSTPKGVFAELARKAIEWGRVTITLADERWVPPSHADSNERLLREHLLVGDAVQAQFVSLTTEAASPALGLADVTAAIRLLPTFDVVLLGMGEDGHTASLFPAAEALAHGLDRANPEPCIAVIPPVAPHARMSLTLSRLLDTRRLVLHITGEAKAAVWQRALAERNPMTLPVSALLSAGGPALEVYWSP